MACLGKETTRPCEPQAPKWIQSQIQWWKRSLKRWEKREEPQVCQKTLMVYSLRRYGHGGEMDSERKTCSRRITRCCCLRAWSIFDEPHLYIWYLFCQDWQFNWLHGCAFNYVGNHRKALWLRVHPISWSSIGSLSTQSCCTTPGWNWQLPLGVVRPRWLLISQALPRSTMSPSLMIVQCLHLTFSQRQKSPEMINLRNLQSVIGNHFFLRPIGSTNHQVRQPDPSRRHLQQKLR